MSPLRLTVRAILAGFALCSVSLTALAVPNDGSYANAPLLLGSDSKLYGTTRFGGHNGNGIIFRIARDGANYEVLHRFQAGAEGAQPESGLAQGTDGNFYGTTRVGGTANLGTVYRLTPAGAFTTLYSFSNGPDGHTPTATLVPAGADFIGTTSGGGGGAGTVFRITTNGVLTTLATLTGATGSYAYKGFTMHADGNFYTTAFSGGTGSGGTVIRLTPGGTLSAIHSFTAGANGAFPLSGLIQGTDGHRYGTTTRTFENGTTSFNRGTIFRLTDTGAFQHLSTFAENGTDGGYPVGNLVEVGRDPVADVTTFVGVTEYAGANGGGTLFRIDVPGSTAVPPQPLMKIRNFTNETGLNPKGGPISGGDGHFYGTTSYGGEAFSGTIYRMNGPGPSFGEVTVLYHLNVPDPPPNDHFANAQPIAGPSGTVNGTTHGATAEASEPQHAGDPAENSIWYTWVAPHSGQFVFDTQGSSFAPRIAIYTGSALSGLTEVASHSSFTSYSRVAFAAVSGTSYRIALDMYDVATVLNWHAANPPANDDFANAQEISGGSGSVAATNLDATKEPGEPAHNGFEGGASVWFKWTAPETGRFLFEVTGAQTPIFAVYRGSTVDSLAGIARAFTPPVRQFDAVAGAVYHIAVDDSTGLPAPNFTLQWRDVPPAETNYTPYAFTTLSGNPPGNVDGAGGNARFNRATNAAVDGAGNIYVADYWNHTIRKVTPAGQVTTIAGAAGNSGHVDGAAAAARFAFPGGVAVGPDGFLYVTETVNQTIRKISPGGEVSTIAGQAGIFGNRNGPAGSALFDIPYAIAVAGDGTIFLTEASHAIRKITPGGEVSVFAGAPDQHGSADGSGEAARFYYPSGLALDADGGLYVADYGNGIVRKVTPAGNVSTIAGTARTSGHVDAIGSEARFGSPYSVTVDAAGNVYVADSFFHTVRKIAPNQQVSTVAGTPGAVGSVDGTGSAARFRSPSGVAVSPSGILYVADTGNSTLRAISSGGAVTTLAGLTSPGTATGSASSSRFNGNRGLASDTFNLYLADTGNHTIRKLTLAGDSTDLAGLPGNSGNTNGTGTAARFSSPRGVASGPNGDVYVADTGNHRIRKITSAGVVTTLAGASSGSVDGTGTAARFRSPNAITFDSSSGNVFVADTSNHTIRKITAAGVVTTFAGTAGQSGSDDGTGSAARFNTPRGLVFSSDGNIYVADTGNHVVRKITPAGVVTTLAGTARVNGSGDGVGAAARFTSPTAIAVYGGDIFVSTTNNLIRKITPSGIVTTLAGAPGQNGSQDGAGAGVRFDAPSGIAFEYTGRLFVSDTNNNAVRASALPFVLNAAASRKTHGSAGSFLVQLARSGTPTIEPRRGGPNGDHTLVFTFNREVASGNVIVTSGTGSVAGSPTASGFDLVVNLTGVADAQALTVRLDNVADSAGQTLPETTITVRFLVGDTNQSGAVNSGDALQTRNRAGQTVSLDNFVSDVNTDGLINSGDATIVKARSGNSTSAAVSLPALGE